MMMMTQEYRPIETAPADTPVWLCGWMYPRSFMGHDAPLEWTEDAGFAFLTNPRGYRYRDCSLWVTHWKPLPPVPEATA